MTKLRYVLKRMSVTGARLSELTGMSKSSIYKYLSGNRELSLKTARKMAAVLGVAAEDLVGEVTPETFV